MSGYRTIVADPPWQYLKSGVVSDGKGRRYAEDNYPTLTMEEIAALPVQELADENAHLYLWTTCPRLYHDRNRPDSPTPFDIMRGWGFDYRTLLTWVKGDRVGMGAYFRVDTEHVLFGIRGSAPIVPEMRESNVVRSARTRHSEKPDAFLDMVERVSPSPRIELFARRQRFGWDTWGDQAFASVDLAASRLLGKERTE
jgi:N6-adenosine-specific RNA methylase IME4